MQCEKNEGKWTDSQGVTSVLLCMSNGVCVCVCVCVCVSEHVSGVERKETPLSAPGVRCPARSPLTMCCYNKHKFE